MIYGSVLMVDILGDNALAQSSLFIRINRCPLLVVLDEKIRLLQLIQPVVISMLAPVYNVTPAVTHSGPVTFIDHRSRSLMLEQLLRPVEDLPCQQPSV